MRKKHRLTQKITATILIAVMITIAPGYNISAADISDISPTISEDIPASEDVSVIDDISDIDSPDNNPVSGELSDSDESDSFDNSEISDDTTISDTNEITEDSNDYESSEVIDSSDADEPEIEIESVSRMGECGAGLNWDYNKGTLTISGSGDMYDFGAERIVPWEDIKSGYVGIKTVIVKEGVTHIGNYAFNEGQITSISLPSSLKTIGDYAFYGTSIQALTIPGKVESIGDYAFFACSELKSISIPSSVKTIGDGAFLKCYNLEKVTFASGLRSIGSRAFEDCDALKEVKLPSSLEKLSPCFNSCDKLTTVSIPGIKVVETGTFNECPSLTSVTLAEGIEEIEADAFSEASLLGNVKFPSSLKVIGNSAFKDCTSITSVTIPDNVTDIKYSAFYGCSEISSITLGKSLISIEYGAFAHANKVSSVTIPETVTFIGSSSFPAGTRLNVKRTYEYEKSRGVYEAYDFTSLSSIPNLYATGVDYKIGDNITFFYSMDPDNSGCYNMVIQGSGRMYDNPRIDERYKSKISGVVVNVGTNIPNIGANAFAGMSSLKKVVLSDSVTEIGDNAFDNCSYLESINLNKSVKTIGNSAFRNCSRLNAVYFSNNLTDIGDYAFYYCPITAVSFPDSLTSIGSNAFSTTRISSLTSFGKVKTIGEAAFNNCSYLTMVSIPGTVEEIGNFAFSNCSKLSSLSLSSGISSIGEYAFSSCSALTNVSIPGSVKTIGNDAFSYCSNLSSVYFNYGLTSIGEEAFSGCSNITSINLPSSVMYLGSDAFEQCSKLASVNLGSIKVLDDFFSGCYALRGKTLTIPDSVEKIIGGCFSDYIKINLVFNKDYKWYTASNEPVELSFDALSSDNYESTNLYRGDVYTHYADGSAPVKPVVITYSIAFNSNGGTGTMTKMSNIVAGNNITLPKNTFTKPGYTFLGWAKSSANAANGTVDIEDQGSFSHSPAASGTTITLYAVWKGTKYYVSFDVNAPDVTAIPYSLAKNYGDKMYDLPRPGARKSYIFNGWYDSETKESVNENTIVTKDTLLKARWKPITESLQLPYITVNGKILSSNYGSSRIYGNDVIGFDSLNSNAELTYTVKQVNNNGTSVTLINKKPYTGPFTLNPDKNIKYEVYADVTRVIDEKNTLQASSYYVFSFITNSSNEVMNRGFELEVHEPKLGMDHQTWPEGNSSDPGISVTYSGSAITFDKLTVRKDGKELILNKDYRVSYANNTKPASYNAVDKNGKSVAPCITITGIGNYAGKATRYFSIKPADNLISISKNYSLIFTDTGTAKAPKLHYLGKEQAPEVRMVPKNNSYPELTAGIDYEALYYNNINAGKAYVKIVGKGNYYGTIKKEYVIAPYDFSVDTDLSLIIPESFHNKSPYYYGKGGSEPNLSISVTDNNGFTEQLYGLTDYKLVYKNNDSVNTNSTKTASVEIVGCGNYKGTYKSDDLTFKIKPGVFYISATNTVRYIPNKPGIYNFSLKAEDPNGAGASGWVKIPSSDYAIAYYYTSDTDVINNKITVRRHKDDIVDKRDILPANTEIRVEIKGKNNYTGFTTDTTVTFTDERSMSVQADNINWENKAGLKPKIQVVDEITGTTLKAGTDYDKNIIYTYANESYVTRTINRVQKKVLVSPGEVVNPKDIVSLGTEINVTVKGIKNYDGFEATTSTKYLFDISKAKITIKPQPRIVDTAYLYIPTYDDFVIKNNNITVDDYYLYQIFYSLNGKSGGVVIRGRNNCFGTKSINFDTVPIQLQ